MKNTYTKISKCRLCNGIIENKIVFPNTPIGNNLLRTKKSSKLQKQYPLIVNKCTSCGHFQLGISIDPDILYKKNYTYLSGIGKNFIKHFDNYSIWVVNKLKLKKNDFVLDIGSNDGTCLQFFKKRGMKVCGVDPAKLPAKISNKNGIECINSFFNKKAKEKLKKKYGNAKFVTSHNVLAHIHDIQETFRLIYEILVVDGYFCFEVGYFFDVLTKNNFDTIYHEHLDYHTAKPLVRFLNNIGFSVKLIEINSIQGGTMRLLAKKEKNIKNNISVYKFIKKEQKINSGDILIEKFKKNLKKNLININKYLFLCKKNKSKLIGYGSPTKAALYSKLLKIDSKVMEYTFEDNPLKIKKFIPGTDIQIKLFNKYMLNKVDVIFIFAWNFQNIIIDKIKQNLKKSKKLEIIIPNPSFKILKL